MLVGLIVGINGQPVQSSSDLQRLLRARRPGDTVRVAIVRGSQRRTISVQLGEAPPA